MPEMVKAYTFTERGEEHDCPKAGSWESYCDCMFLEYDLGLRTVIQWFADGVQLLPGIPVGVDPNGIADVPQNVGPTTVRGTVEQKIEQLAAIGIRATPRNFVGPPIKTENWYKCMRKGCANPFGGCWNAYTQSNDPFDIGIGINTEPWTELGSVARGIPSRDGSAFLKDLAALFSYDPKEFESLEMWKVYWENPGLYALRVVKAGVIAGGIGTLLGGAGTATLLQNVWVWSQNLGVFGTAALLDCITKRKDVFAHFFTPMLAGGVQSMLDFFNAFPLVLQAGFAAKPFELGGWIGQKVAADQIRTGEVNRIYTPELRVGVYFLARAGRDIGKALDASIGGDAQSGFIGVINAISAGLEAALIAGKLPDPNNPGHTLLPDLVPGTNDPAPESILWWLGVAFETFEVVRIMVLGVSRGDDAEAIINRIFTELFYFGWYELIEAIKKGPAAVNALFARARASNVRGRPSPSAGHVLRTLSEIAKFIGDIVQTITQIGSSLGSAGQFVVDLGSKIALVGQDFSVAVEQVKPQIEAVAQTETPAVTTSAGQFLTATPSPFSTTPAMSNVMLPVGGTTVAAPFTVSGGSAAPKTTLTARNKLMPSFTLQADVVAPAAPSPAAPAPFIQTGLTSALTNLSAGLQAGTVKTGQPVSGTDFLKMMTAQENIIQAVAATSMSQGSTGIVDLGTQKKDMVIDPVLAQERATKAALKAAADAKAAAEAERAKKYPSEALPPPSTVPQPEQTRETVINVGGDIEVTVPVKGDTARDQLDTLCLGCGSIAPPGTYATPVVGPGVKPSSSIGALAGGAAVGFIAGGPLGAAIGAGLALAFGKK